MSSDERVIKSYVWHKQKCYFVSTIERDSSAMSCQHRYNETIVWEYYWENGERLDYVHQDEDCKHSIKTHLSICERIFKEGPFWKELKNDE